MVDFKNMRFTASEVITICINFAGLVFMYAVMTTKLDVLIAAYKGKEAEDKQLHKEQAAQYQNIIIDQAILGSRVTQVEQKVK